MAHVVGYYSVPSMYELGNNLSGGAWLILWLRDTWFGQSLLMALVNIQGVLQKNAWSLFQKILACNIDQPG